MKSVTLDPELGEIEKHEKTWTVRAATIDVSVIGEDVTPAARAAIIELRASFERLLREPIADELLQLESNAERTTPRNAIYTVYTLAGATLEIAADGKVVLEVGFEPSWSPNHHVTVFLEDWIGKGSTIDS